MMPLSKLSKQKLFGFSRTANCRATQFGQTMSAYSLFGNPPEVALVVQPSMFDWVHRTAA